MNPKKNIKCSSFYGAANTSDGFFSLFDSIFSPERLKKIYILKGGPGCGKSTTMKRISAKAALLGYDTENYYCSSSPTSLDGVIIPELSTAVLDGTAPHTVDPAYPAVCETIVNLGDAWNTDAAAEYNEEIRFLNGMKKAAYSKAYAYLSSCRGANSVVRGCLSSYLLDEKLLRAAERLCSKLKYKKGSGKTRMVFTDCNSGNGNIHLTTFEDNAGTKYFIKDFAGIAPTYFEYLCDVLTAGGADITVALDPLEPEYVRGIYIDSCSTSFTVYDDEYARTLDRQQRPYKIINTARFCDTDGYRRQRSFLKYAEKAEKNLYAGAVRELSDAAQHHDEIEKLYYKITDFAVIERIASELEGKIFGD